MRIVVAVGDNAQSRRGEPPDSAVRIAETVDRGFDAAASRLVFSPGTRASARWTAAGWPRTQDLTVELPDLVAAIADRFGPVDRISLDPEAWNSRPRTVTIGERVVLLDWFGARQRHTVGLFGPHSSRFDLLVIPPDTAMIVALACLTMQTPTESSPEREQRNRWEDDGGRTGCAVPQLRGGESVSGSSQRLRDRRTSSPLPQPKAICWPPRLHVPLLGADRTAGSGLVVRVPLVKSGFSS